MADNVVIYFVGFQGGIYEANMVTGKYFWHPDGERLAARQRALTRAGTPWADWGPNAPSSMLYEFGTPDLSVAQLGGGKVTDSPIVETRNRVRGPETQPFDQLQGISADVKAVAAEVRAGNGINGPLDLVRDNITGAVYAVAPKVFYHIKKSSDLALGQRVGIYSKTYVELTTAEIDNIRKIVDEENSGLYVPPVSTDKK